MSNHKAASTPVRDVILIDNRDSFTYNLLEEFAVLGAAIKVLRNDVPVTVLADILHTARQPLLVLSPGPGAPEQAGLCLDYIRAFMPDTALLGICLGHQALVQACGGTVVRAPTPVHGECSVLTLAGDKLFSGLNAPIHVARYHSLVATQLPACLQAIAHADGLCMAVRHLRYAAVGLQFHPESILTAQGRPILRNLLTQLRCPSAQESLHANLA